MTDDISDALAAALLKKEATERSLRSSALGLEAFTRDRKKPNSVPKPNTRFLRNLVKEADSHNAALLAKEAEESRLRLEKFKREERRRRDRESRGGHRSHRRNDSYSRSRSRSRSRSPERSHRNRRSRSRSKDRSSRRWRDEDDGRPNKRRKVENVGDIDKMLQAARRSKRDERHGEKEAESRRKDEDGHRHRSRRDRSRSKDRDVDKRHSHRERSRDRDRKKHRTRRSRSPNSSRSPSRSRSSSGDRRRHHRSSQRKSRRSRTRSASPRKHGRKASPRLKTQESLSDGDDDPLAPFLKRKSSPSIGPSPMFPSQATGIRARGRGITGSSAMDAHFSSNYDPTMDVVPTNPEDEDDWEAALEAIRDRKKWKQQGADRLREAGFDDEFISAWETNTTKDENKIKWTKDKGGRDWDRGKVVNEETGEVELKAAWT